jgi:hypothetical protein
VEASSTNITCPSLPRQSFWHLESVVAVQRFLLRHIGTRVARTLPRITTLRTKIRQTRRIEMGMCDEYPKRADLRKDLTRPLPFIPPGTLDVGSMNSEATNAKASAVLDSFNAALQNDDAAQLASLFSINGQASYWRDMLALTCHLRTFTTPSVIAASLLETKALRGLVGGFKLSEPAKFVPINPVLVSPRPLFMVSFEISIQLEISTHFCQSNSSNVGSPSRRARRWRAVQQKYS